MKIKFNGMDIFIIAVLVVVIAAGGLFLMGRNRQQADSKDTTIRLMVEFKDQEEGFAELINIGDEAVVGEKEKTATTVTKVEKMLNKGMGYNTIEGWVKETEIPGRYDVQVTLEGKGVDTGDTVEFSNNPVRVGTNVAVKNKNWSGYGTILSVETVE